MTKCTQLLQQISVVFESSCSVQDPAKHAVKPQCSANVEKTCLRSMGFHMEHGRLEHGRFEHS